MTWLEIAILYEMKYSVPIPKGKDIPPTQELSETPTTIKQATWVLSNAIRHLAKDSNHDGKRMINMSGVTYTIHMEEPLPKG